MGNRVIYNAGGILIKNKRLLIVREQNHEFFIMPGGSIKNGELPTQTLIRELLEEVNVRVGESDLEKYGSFLLPAVGEAGKQINMDVFFVKSWQNEPIVSGDIEEMRWVNSGEVEDLKTGFIIKKLVPELKSKKFLN